jgi:hypothetical protein
LVVLVTLMFRGQLMMMSLIEKLNAREGRRDRNNCRGSHLTSGTRHCLIMFV